MKKIGAILKNERERQGLSLEEVSQKTKITLEKLQWIENSESDKLPAKVFLKGLIRGYASVLGMDLKSVQTIYEEEFADPLPPADLFHEEMLEEDSSPKAKPEISIRIKQFAPFIFGGAIVVVLVLLIATFVGKLRSYEREKAIESIAVAPPPPPKSDQQDNPEPKPEKGKEKPQEKNVEITKPTLEVKKSSANTKPLRKKTTAISKTDDKLVIEAMEPVKIEIQWSQGPPQMVLMKAREKKTLVFSNPLKVRIQNGGAVMITFNNQSEGIPGESNQPVELSYP